VTGGPDQAARVTTPTLTQPMSIEQYLAAHRADALQSQAARITVQWDNASIGTSSQASRRSAPGRSSSQGHHRQRHRRSQEPAVGPRDERGARITGPRREDAPRRNPQRRESDELARADSTVPITTRLVRINYAKARRSCTPWHRFSPKRGNAVADSTSNSLVITEITSRIDEVVEFVKGLDQRTPQVSIQAKIIFVDRQDVEQLGIKYDLGSTTQFFNRLIQRPDPRTAKPVDTDLDGVPDALVPTGKISPSNENIVSLGGNSLSALGNAGQEVINPALDLIFFRPRSATSISPRFSRRSRRRARRRPG